MMIQNHIVLFTRVTLVIADDIEGSLGNDAIYKGTPCPQMLSAFNSIRTPSSLSV